MRNIKKKIIDFAQMLVMDGEITGKNYDRLVDDLSEKKQTTRDKIIEIIKKDYFDSSSKGFEKVADKILDLSDKQEEKICKKNCPDYKGMELLHIEQCDCSCHKKLDKQGEIDIPCTIYYDDDYGQEYKFNCKAPDEVIIRECLNYCFHRIRKHRKFIPEYLDRINELREQKEPEVYSPTKHIKGKLDKGITTSSKEPEEGCPKCKKSYTKLLGRAISGTHNGKPAYVGKCPHCATIIVETERETQLPQEKIEKIKKRPFNEWHHDDAMFADKINQIIKVLNIIIWLNKQTLENDKRFLEKLK